MIIPFKESSLSLQGDESHFFEQVLLTYDDRSQEGQNRELFFIYKMQSSSICQTGLICLVPFANDSNFHIHPHELTLREKEDCYFEQLQRDGKQRNPVILVHAQSSRISNLIRKVTKMPCTFRLTSEDQVTHSVWKINKPSLIKLIQEVYSPIRTLYIADGHHRFAAVKRMAALKPWLHHIAALLIPDDQINLLSFHRICTFHPDFLQNNLRHLIEKNFVMHLTSEPFQPVHQNEFGLYMGDKWFLLRLRESIFNDFSGDNAVGSDILEKYLLSACGDFALHYLPGDKSLLTLKEQVDALCTAVGFSLAAIPIQYFLQAVEAKMLFPPHSTYFLPKPLHDTFVYSMHLHPAYQTAEVI